MRMLLGLILMVAGAAAFAAEHDCRFSAERNLDIDPAGLKALALVLGSSDARVQGVAGIKRIEVRGKACASDADWLKNLTLEQERSGDRATVTAAKDHGIHMNWFGSSYAYLNVEVRMPTDLAVDIHAGSGDVDVAGVALLDFGSGSGDLRASHIAGDALVKVGSGDVIIDDVGKLRVERTGSGDIRASGVHGAVTVGHVGSGDLNFRDVAGGVQVESVGSGDVMVRGAGGDVVVGSVGSGDVTVDGVHGDFVVRNAGSGDLRHHNVTGRIDVPTRHADD
jgi:DUF4097 and DUF4098 domain-containing protein YvlB